jgi:hypothetical protein
MAKVKFVLGFTASGAGGVTGMKTTFIHVEIQRPSR